MTRKKLLVFSLAAAFALGALPCLRPADLQAADLGSIAFAKEAPGVVFTVRIRGEFGNEAFMLREPERLVIDVSPVESIAAANQTEVNEGGVLRVRTGRFQADVARLVFDLDGPGVMYRIDRTADGLKITFWKEGQGIPAPGVKPAAPIEPKVEPKLEPQAKPEKPAETPPSPAAPNPGKARREAGRSAGSDRRFRRRRRRFRKRLLRLRGRRDRGFPEPRIDGHPQLPHQRQGGNGGIGLHPEAEHAGRAELGRYVRLREMSLKLGLDIEYWNFKSEGTHVFTVPHPFLADTDRTLDQANSFRSYFTAVTAFALARIYTNGTMTVAAGPEIGFASGKYRLLDTIDIADAPPYTEAELSIREVTYADTSASSLLAGFRAEFEYALSAKLSLILDVKATYFSPEITELSKKLGLSQAGAILGIQYNF